MIEKWNYFVYDLCEAKKKDVDEDSFHALIETQLQHLGWAKFKGEICHKPSIHLGNNNSIVPDIIIKKDGEDEFVIEVKRPSHKQSKKDVDQLLSYMRILKLSVGIYIGDRIEIFYDMPASKEAVSVMKVPLEIDNKQGAKFIDKFLKENFSRDAIIEFCEERIQEIQRQNSLNEIKESLIADAQMQIAESLRPYLMDKYGNAFSEEEIKGMLSQLRFTVTTNDAVHPQVTSAPSTSSVIQTNPVQLKHIIKCHLTRNADAHGLFNIESQTLTVLKGSAVNPKHLTATVEKKRAGQLEDYTILQAGKRIVKKDVTFDSPSGAAVFCVGGSTNGWDTWKDEQGRMLNVYRNNSTKDKTKVRFDANRVTDPRKFQLDFWTKFKVKLEATGKIPTLQTPQPHNWYDVRIGRSNILLNIVCNTQKNFVGVKLYIRKPVVEKYFPALMARKNEITLALGCEPEWDANPAAMDKTIALFHKTDLTNQETLAEALDWLVQQTIIFYNVFSKEVKGI